METIKEMTARQIAETIDLAYSTVLTTLGRPEFNKHLRTRDGYRYTYVVSDAFKEDLKDAFRRKNHKASYNEARCSKVDLL